MMEWYKNRFANFSGRATRSEYFTVILYGFLTLIVLSCLGYLSKNIFVLAFLNLKSISLILLIPFSAVTVRRIRDLGFNGGWFFLNFIPFVNLLLILCLLFIKGEEKKNAYGESPYNLEMQ